MAANRVGVMIYDGETDDRDNRPCVYKPMRIGFFSILRFLDLKIKILKKEKKNVWVSTFLK